MKEFRFRFKVEKISERDIKGLKIIAYDRLFETENDHYHCSFELDEEVSDRIINLINIGLSELFIKIGQDNKLEVIENKPIMATSYRHSKIFIFDCMNHIEKICEANGTSLEKVLDDIYIKEKDMKNETQTNI